MSLISLLKITWTVVGLKAPWFAWVAAGVLFGGTIFLLGWLWWLVRKEVRIHLRTLERLKDLKARFHSIPREGLTREAYDAIAQVFEGTPSLGPAWHNFNAQILFRLNSTGEERFWASESADGAFSEAVVIEPRLNRGFFTAVPGIVTGAGLLITFVAILVALLDVRLEQTQVQGLDLLIHGLSGKFISSIAALFAATIFLLFESPLLHGLTKSRRDLVTTMDDLFPRLSAALILADIHRDIAEQSTAFRHFNSDLSLRLKQSFTESIGPTLLRMVETIDGLNQLLRAAEAQKQESITGSLESLLRNLEQSISRSLDNMGAKFTESLSGTAMDEFVKVSESLGGAARLLESMNAQFQTTQSALSELVNFAKASTVEQMALGKTQVEELTAVLRGLMTQMKETTGSSVSTMANALGAMVHELSTNVSELGEQMKNTMLESTGKATSAASTVIQQADAWSSQNSENLAQLIARHQTHLDAIKGVQTTIDTTLARFKEALGQYTTITVDLRQISAQVSATVASAAGTTQIMKDTQNAVQRVASLAAAQVEQLAEANRRQEETWQNISESMRQYQQVFTQVEGEASTLLRDIAQNARHLAEISRDGLQKLMKDSNEHFATAAQRLGATVNELDERLTDLTEILAKVR